MAWADPNADGRGHGPSVSRQPDTTPLQNSGQKKTPMVSPPKKDVWTEKRRVQAVANRERLRAQRASILAKGRQGVKESLPYRRPPEPGGVV